MDMMILGETIRADATGTVCTGFWMPSAGVDGVAGVEVFYSSGAMKVELQTKSSDEADSAATSIGTGTVAAVTVATMVKFDVTAAKDLVRYVVTGTTVGVWMHAQFLQPMWAPN